MENTIDGANVIEYASKDCFGIAETDDGNEKPIMHLVLAKYDAESRIYLFACDFDYKVLGDTIHNNIEEAKEFASRFYLKDIFWCKLSQ